MFTVVFGSSLKSSKKRHYIVIGKEVVVMLKFTLLEKDILEKEIFQTHILMENLSRKILMYSVNIASLWKSSKEVILLLLEKMLLY